MAMEHKETKTMFGRLTVGTDGEDPPRIVSVRIDGNLGQDPVRALGPLDSPEKVNGMIAQLSTMRDEVWGPQSGATRGTRPVQGSVEVVHNTSNTDPHEVHVSGHAVLAYASKDRASTAASKIRQRLTNGEAIGTAVVAVTQEMG